jgi:hypothetical protein
MNYPPAILDLVVSPQEGRRVHVWLPLFLLWPVVLVLGVLALVFTVITDVILLAVGRRYHHYTILVARSLMALCDTRGMVIRIHDKDATVDLTVQ